MARIPYTQPVLPSLPEVWQAIQVVWSSGTVANRGPKEIAFERALRDTFSWDHVVLTSSCTSAMYLLLAGAELEGEVIVSSFTHPATLQAARLQGLETVPVDVNPSDLTIDVAAVEAVIGPRTSAILATHLFGNPCDVEQLAAVSGRHGLMLVFDAASAVGVAYRDRPISSFGDGLAFSFHATKLLTTLEGGAAVCRDRSLADDMMSLRNFGISEGRMADRRGLNAKMNELAAALGILGLAIVDDEIRARKRVLQGYAEGFRQMDGLELVAPRDGTTPNFAAAPIRISSAIRPTANAQDVAKHLSGLGIESRQYFAGRYQHADSSKGGPHTEADLARREVLCLPVFGGLTSSQLGRIIDGVRNALDGFESGR